MPTICDDRHFCTQFKKMMNMAPTAYQGATVYKTT